MHKIKWNQIDIVYLWVDGSDESWKMKRWKAFDSLSERNYLETYANVEWRFRDNNELLYSLRSLEKYFPEHGNIYIVTDGQIPPFLGNDRAGIQVISHEKFMRAGTYPTFSSKNIVSQIADIPSISEKFLVLNDDIFLWPDFEVTDFFDESGIKTYFVDAEWREKSWEIIYSNSSEALLAKRYSDYIITGKSVAHTPKAVIKSSYIEMRKEFHEVYEAVTTEVFRDERNPSMVGDLYSRWMVHMMKGSYGKKQGFYTQTNNPRYSELFEQFQNIAFFCVNDTHDDAEYDTPGLIEFRSVLCQLFPEPSRFEINHI